MQVSPEIFEFAVYGTDHYLFILSEEMGGTLL
jgi:hypothetical protein